MQTTESILEVDKKSNQVQTSEIKSEDVNEAGNISSIVVTEFKGAGNVTRDFVSILGAGNIDDIILEEDEEDEVLFNLFLKTKKLFF